MAKKNTVEIILSARDQASKAVQQAFGSIRSASGTALAAVGSAAVAAGGALVTLTGIVGKVGLSYNAMMEQSNIAWGTILGSQEEAKKTLQQLQTMGAKTPFEFEGLDKAAKLLNMAGYHGDDLFKTLTSVGDAVSAVGGGQAELEGISMAIFQMASKGKISAEEMNQLAERGIPAWKMIADAQGKSVEEVMKMSQEGKLMSKDVLPQLTDQLGKTFGGSMEKQSSTFNGMMSTLKDNFKMISAELTKGAFERFKGVLNSILPVLDKFLKGLQEGGLKGALRAVLPQETADFIINTFTTIQSVIATVFGFIKSQFTDTGSVVNTVFPVIWQVVSTAFGVIKEVATTVWNFFKDNILPIFVSLYEWISGNMPTIRGVVETVFNKIKEVALMVWNFFKDNILPILANLYGFIKEKMPQIQRIVETVFGIVASVVRTVWDIFENLLLPALKKIWDWISPYIPKVQEIIETAFSAIFDAVELVVGIFDDVANAIENAIDWLTFWDDKKVSKKTIEVEEKHTTSRGKVNIPQYASGTSFHPGGVALVGEEGPELVDLPRGSKVFTASRTMQMASSASPLSIKGSGNLPDQIASAVGNAIMQAMQFNRQTGPSGDIVLNIDGRTFARIIKPYADMENKRVGTDVRLQSI